MSVNAQRKKSEFSNSQAHESTDVPYPSQNLTPDAMAEAVAAVDFDSMGLRAVAPPEPGAHLLFGLRFDIAPSKTIFFLFT